MDWLKNRALKRRFVEKVLQPAGAAQLSRDLFLIELIRDYSIEIDIGNAEHGTELWFGTTWRSPRYSRVMARVQHDAPDLAEAWRGVGRFRYAEDSIGGFRTGLTSMEVRDTGLVIRSYRDGYGELREQDFDAAAYFRLLGSLGEMDALAEEVNFGLSGQFTAALDGVWSFLYLACEQGHTPDRVLADFTGPEYRGPRPAWRLKNPLTRDGIAEFQRHYRAEAG